MDNKGLAVRVNNSSNLTMNGGEIARNSSYGIQISGKTDWTGVKFIMNGGKISDRKGINVPNVDLSMPYLSDKDRDDIEFGIKAGFDFIAASFVRTREDIQEVRKIVEDRGSKIKIITKIENMQGIQNLEEIINVADGIMVARGDMGVEIPLEEVPICRRR